MTHKKESVLSYDYVDVNIEDIKKKDLTFYPLDYFSGKVPPAYMKFFFWKYERVYLFFATIPIKQDISHSIIYKNPYLPEEQKNKLFDNLYIRYTKNDKVVFTNKVNDMKKGWHKIKGGDNQIIELGISSKCIDILSEFNIERIQLQLRGYNINKEA